VEKVAEDYGTLAFLQRYHKPFSMDESDDGQEA
jgi:hypothetical protein